MRARIERADIEKLAALARLKLGNAEVEALARDVESILAYVSKLPAGESVDTQRDARGQRIS